jgi:hypothetical protein
MRITDRLRTKGALGKGPSAVERILPKIAGEFARVLEKF